VNSRDSEARNSRGEPFLLRDNMPKEAEQKDLFIKNPIWWEGLKGRQKLFVECYCTDRSCFLNATAAYIKAYGNGGKELAVSSIQSNASRLMRDNSIKLAIAKLLRARQNDEDRISEYKLLDYLNTLAYYNPKDILDKYGGLKTKDLSELGDLAICITGIKKTKNGYEIKLYDRNKAIDILAQYHDISRAPEGTTIINPVVCLTDKDIDALQKTESNTTPNAVEADYEVMNEEPDSRDRNDE